MILPFAEFKMPKLSKNISKEKELQILIDESVGSDHLVAEYNLNSYYPYGALWRYPRLNSRPFLAENKEELLEKITEYFDNRKEIAKEVVLEKGLSVFSTPQEAEIKKDMKLRAQVHSLSFPEEIEVTGEYRDENLEVDLVSFFVCGGKRKGENSHMLASAIWRDYELVA